MVSMSASQWNLFNRFCSKTELGLCIILIILQMSETQDSSVLRREVRILSSSAKEQKNRIQTKASRVVLKWLLKRSNERFHKGFIKDLKEKKKAFWQQTSRPYSENSCSSQCEDKAHRKLCPLHLMKFDN